MLSIKSILICYLLHPLGSLLAEFGSAAVINLVSVADKALPGSAGTPAAPGWPAQRQRRAQARRRAALVRGLAHTRRSALPAVGCGTPAVRRAATAVGGPPSGPGAWVRPCAACHSTDQRPARSALGSARSDLGSFGGQLILGRSSRGSDVVVDWPSGRPKRWISPETGRM